MGFADGSVKFVKSTITMNAWWSIGTKAGNEPVDGTEFDIELMSTSGLDDSSVPLPSRRPERVARRPRAWQQTGSGFFAVAPVGLVRAGRGIA